MTETDLTRPAYPAAWTIAQVLSHLGSGAVITQRRLDDAFAGRATPDDFAPSVWDAWNAKGPAAQRDDALTADAALIAQIDTATAEQGRTFTFALGPMTLDFEQFIGLRLNEHALHTWDIEVVENPTASIPHNATSLVIDNLELIARFTARPTGDTMTVTVATTDPARAFAIELAPEAVTFTPTAAPTTADLELPGEAFIRLVYGRLDPAHTPPGPQGTTLETLRHVFPGP
jgi:uncharacterized protein (TIGR03083 family)